MTTAEWFLNDDHRKSQEAPHGLRLKPLHGRKRFHFRCGRCVEYPKRQGTPREEGFGHGDRQYDDNVKHLEERTVAAAEAALAERKVVTAIDVFQGIEWLPQVRVDEWRQGCLAYLEGAVSTNQHKISAVMSIFQRWVRSRGLVPRQTEYVSRTRDRHRLQFSKSGALAIERAYGTHWVSPDLSVAKQERLVEREGRAPDLVVSSPLRDWTCGKCGGSGDFLLMDGVSPLCRHCAKLDHLVFLPAGDAAFSRRAKQASGLSVIVVRFSRSPEALRTEGHPRRRIRANTSGGGG